MNSDLDFRYVYPPVWVPMDMAPAIPVIRMQEEKHADSEIEKRGISCTQLIFRARNPKADGTVTVLVIQNACLGTTLSPQSLSSLPAGLIKGLGAHFDLSNQQYGAYSIGEREFAIVKANGISKIDKDQARILEATCTIHQQGLLCWLLAASDKQQLDLLENSSVQFGKEPAAQLVPDSTLNRIDGVMTGWPIQALFWLEWGSFTQ